MAISQPTASDQLSSPDHSLSHRVFANDSAAPVQSIVVNSYGNSIYSPVVYDDLRVPVTSTKAGVSKDPGFTVYKKDTGGTSQGVFIYWFDASAEEELYFTVQFPHTWDGGDITPHVHWIPKTTADPNTETVEWGLEYTWADIDTVFGVTSLVYAKSVTGLVADTHYMTSFSAITPSASQDGISSMMICRVFRNATDGTDDTYDDDAGLLEIDFHYGKDTLGSRTVLIK